MEDIQMKMDDGREITICGDKTFYMVDENGEKKLYHMLISIDSDDKSYLAYTDLEADEDGAMSAHAVIYHPEDFNKGFEPIETEEEWNMVEKYLNAVQDIIKEAMNENKEGTNSEAA